MEMDSSISISWLRCHFGGSLSTISGLAKAFDTIKVILSTNRSDDLTNKKEGFVHPLAKRVNKIRLG